MAARSPTPVAYYRVRYIGAVHVLSPDGRRDTFHPNVPRAQGAGETYEDAVDAMMTLLEEHPPRDAKDRASLFERVEIVTVDAKTGHMIDLRTDADDSENLFVASAEPYGASRFFPSEIKGYRWKIDGMPGSKSLRVVPGPRAEHRVGTRGWTKKNLPWSLEEALARHKESPGGAGQFIHLQMIGQVPAKPASEVKPGDILSWNQSHRTHVAVSVRQVSPKFVELTEKNLKTGQTYTRRLGKDKLVAAEEPTLSTLKRVSFSAGMASGRTMKHLARWYARKYGLSTAEANRMANRENVEELEREHEAWRVSHGMPAANSAISRGKLQRMLLDGVGLSAGAAPFRKGARVKLPRRDDEPLYGHVVTGKTKTMKWERVGRPSSNFEAEPHLLIEWEHGQGRAWEPVDTLRPA